MNTITAWERIPVVFDLEYASCLFGIDRKELARLARLNKVPAFKIGAYWHFRKSDVEKWIENQSNGCIQTQSVNVG